MEYLVTKVYYRTDKEMLKVNEVEERQEVLLDQINL